MSYLNGMTQLGVQGSGVKCLVRIECGVECGNRLTQGVQPLMRKEKMRSQCHSAAKKRPAAIAYHLNRLPHSYHIDAQGNVRVFKAQNSMLEVLVGRVSPTTVATLKVGAAIER